MCSHSIVSYREPPKSTMWKRKIFPIKIECLILGGEKETRRWQRHGYNANGGFKRMDVRAKVCKNDELEHGGDEKTESGTTFICWPYMLTQNI